MAELEPKVVNADRKPGDPSVFACPECGGTLWEMHDHDLVRYRCRVGHAYSAEGLLAEKYQNLEAALWTALRALEEQAALSRRMSERAAKRGHGVAAESYRGKVAEAEAHAEVIRRVVLTWRPDPSTEAFEPATPPPAPTAANGLPA
jgi:two-component system chemotaxis response regulator CheB